MVMDHLPRSGFSLIEIRDAMLDRDRLAGKLEPTILDACFEGHISNNCWLRNRRLLIVRSTVKT